MHSSLFYRPHAILAFYETMKAPRDELKRKATDNFSITVNGVHIALDTEEAMLKKAFELGLRQEDFQDACSLLMAIAYYRCCREKVDYYRQKKSVEFAKVFDGYRKMTAKSAIEKLVSLDIPYEDSRKGVKSLQESAYIKGYFERLL